MEGLMGLLWPQGIVGITQELWGSLPEVCTLSRGHRRRAWLPKFRTAPIT